MWHLALIVVACSSRSRSRRLVRTGCWHVCGNAGAPLLRTLCRDRRPAACTLAKLHDKRGCWPATAAYTEPCFTAPHTKAHSTLMQPSVLPRNVLAARPSHKAGRLRHTFACCLTRKLQASRCQSQMGSDGSQPLQQHLLDTQDAEGAAVGMRCRWAASLATPARPSRIPRPLPRTCRHAAPARAGCGAVPRRPSPAGAGQPIWCRALMRRLSAVSQAEHSSQSEVVRLTCRPRGVGTSDMDDDADSRVQGADPC